MNNISVSPAKFALISQKGSTDPDKIWVPCRQGKHFLNGQVSDNSQEYIGLYKVEL